MKNIWHSIDFKQLSDVLSF